ncbi:FHA domain-containing protein [Haliangium sp.]|uniref:FHA domain-containing protein n=1 Tax=Haliangium sp. TaxID=2663208 RepID=UPI003D126D45
MALLASNESERPLTLSSHCLVGRSVACNLRLEDPRISSEHARISWQDSRWTLRDLGSRNGTFLNGTLIEPGGTAALSTGDRLAFGHPSVELCLIDASPPVAMARHLGTGALLQAEDGILALPDQHSPIATVFEDRPGQWVSELDGETQPAADGTVLNVGGEAYMLHLPLGLAPTADAQAGQQRIQDLAFRFRVSQDEERVEVLLQGRSGAQMLPPRAHYYSFLTLARARLRDEDDAELPEPARGWLAVSDLCRMLAVEESRLNVDIYRIRRDLANLGLQNPAAVIERKRGQLRLGTRRIEVMALE